MSEGDRKALARRPAASSYEVGYGKPPAKNRFKPGQSGNPKGRPRGAKNRSPSPQLHEERLKRSFSRRLTARSPSTMRRG